MGFVSRYLRYLRPHGLRIAGIVAAGLVFVAFTGLSFWLSADFIQSLLSGNATVPPLPDQPLSLTNFDEVLRHYSVLLVSGATPLISLRRAIFLIVGAFLLRNVSLYLQTLLAAAVEQSIAKRMRDELYERLMAQDLAFFHVRHSGDLVANVVNDVTQLNEGLAEGFSKLIREPLNVIVFLTLLIAISWKMTLAVLIIAPLTALVTGVAGNSLKRKSRRTQERVGAVTSRLNESLYGVRIVQAYGGEEHELHRFSEATDAHFREALNRERLRRLIPPLEEMVGVIVISGILLVAGGRVLGGQWLAAGDFVRYLLLLFGLLTPIVSLAEVSARLRVAEGAAERVFSLLESRHQIDELPDAKPVSGFNHKLVVEHVSLRYGSDREIALRDFSLTVKPGDRVILVGRSGSGKSSLLNLLPRFYDPTEGRILLDGVDLRELKLDGLRRNFGIVAQEVTLFHDTVRANIAYGRDVPLEDVIAAAKKASIHDVIMELPEGYDTNLGNLGERFSGGQRQRLSIARALLADPPIFLLDEPTSALDGDVADEIQKTLDEVGRGRTVITATHRVSSIRANDRVLLIDGGEVVAQGRHRDLLKKSNLYRDLVERQVGKQAVKKA
ncbi:MAG: ABC transporter ATP-binding protein [bacterium]